MCGGQRRRIGRDAFRRMKNGLSRPVGMGLCIAGMFRRVWNYGNWEDHRARAAIGRAIAISHDLRWLSVGYQRGGQMGLVDLSKPEETWATTRILGTGRVELLSDPEEEDGEDELYC
jgi:hypothetical protein